MFIMIVGITTGTNQVYPYIPDHIDEENNHAHNIVLSMPKKICPASSTIDECSICFDEITRNQSKTLTCKHTYHKKCINLWLEKNIKCPLCRAPVQNSNRQNKIHKFISWMLALFFFIYNTVLTFIYDAYLRDDHITRIDDILPTSVRIVCNTSGLLVFLTVLREHHCSFRHQDVRLEIPTALFAILTIFFEVQYITEPNLPGWLLFYTLVQLIYGLQVLLYRYLQSCH
jgi:hypothetical protein